MKKKIIIFVLILLLIQLFFFDIHSQTKPAIPADKIKYYDDVLKYGTEEELQKVLSELLLYDVTPLLDQLLSLLNSNIKPAIKISIINCIRSLKEKSAQISPYIKNIISDKFSDKNLLSTAILATGDLELKELEDLLYEIFTDKAYKDEVNIIRNILLSLGKMKSTKYMQQIFDFLIDSKNSSEIRAAAALYFAEFDSVDSKYIDKFNEMIIDKTENSFVRRYLIYAISKYKAESSYKYILQAINDEDPYIQIYAAKALKEYNVKEGIDILLNTLRSNNPQVRIEILNLLGELKSLDAIEAIIYKAQYDKDANVRKAARDAFFKILEANKNANIKGELAEKIIDFLKYLYKYDPLEANRLKAKQLLLEIFKITV
ncbi:MAG TPA: HEAT repeat domain-containing protein [Exilispira sp.]|nr:HEAT repeat domain-containing protein [Exilispira sp.]